MRDASPATETSSPDAAAKVILRECEELRGALGRVRLVQFLIALGLVGLVIYLGLALSHQVNRVRSEIYLSELRGRAQERLADRSDAYLNEIEALVGVTSPALTEAFYDQAKADLPRYMAAIGDQREALIESLRIELAETFRQSNEVLRERYRQILEEQFPDVTLESRGRLLDNLETAMNRLAERYYLEAMEAEIHGLYDHWDAFPADFIIVDRKISLGNQLVAELLDLLQIKLTEQQRIGTESSEAPGLPTTSSDADTPELNSPAEDVTSSPESTGAEPGAGIPQ